MNYSERCTQKISTIEFSRSRIWFLDKLPLEGFIYIKRFFSIFRSEKLNKNASNKQNTILSFPSANHGIFGYFPKQFGGSQATAH
jgi:hypothetical protein